MVAPDNYTGGTEIWALVLRRYLIYSISFHTQYHFSEIDAHFYIVGKSCSRVAKYKLHKKTDQF